MEVFGEVRSILQQPPTMLSFFKLRGLIEDRACPEDVFVYIDEHLQKWPPHIFRYPHHSWLPEDGGEVSRKVAFCNAFRLTSSEVSFRVLLAWLSSPHWRQVRFLGLSSLRLSPSQWREFGQIDALRSLLSLDVASCTLGGERIHALCELPFVKELQAINVGYTGLGEEELQVLSSVPWTRLEVLRLRANSLGANLLGPLARGEYWSTLRELDLSNNPVNADGMARLADAGSLEHVTSLGLRGCNITSEGLERLVSSRGFSKLEVLDLSRGAIEDLSKNTHRLARFTRLCELRLHGNRLGANNLEYLLEDDMIPQIEVLDLSVTELGDDGVALLARCERFENLRELDLAGNRMGADGARALARAPWLANLERLDVGLVADHAFDVVEAFANSPYLPEDLKQPWLGRFERLRDRI